MRRIFSGASPLVLEVVPPPLRRGEAGLKKLDKGQRVKFQVTEDGFGGFKASAIEPGD